MHHQINKELAKMEKKITDDHHHDHQASSGDSSARPSLKIRIRITPQIRKQLAKWDKQEEAVKQINVKSEVKEEAKEINVKSEECSESNVVKESIEVVHHHQQVKQELLLVECSSFELKLEATKRKFHDSYQQIANAKRQRRIQVIDPRNLPQPAAASGGKGTSSKLASGGTAKSRILNVIQSNKKTNNNNNNRNNLFSASRSTLLKPSYIC